MTHTWRKVTQILYLALINRHFFPSLLKHTVTFIKTCCVSGATREGVGHSGGWRHLLHKVHSAGQNQPAASQSVVNIGVILSL